MSPWALAGPCAVTLFSCVVALYLTFSPLGLVGGGSTLYGPILGLLLVMNAAIWWRGFACLEALAEFKRFLEATVKSHVKTLEGIL